MNIFFILKIPRKLQAPTGLYTASHKRNSADLTQTQRTMTVNNMCDRRTLFTTVDNTFGGTTVMRS